MTAGERRLVAVPVTAYACGIEEGDGELSYQCPDLHHTKDDAIACPIARTEFRWPGLEQLGARLRDIRERSRRTLADVADHLEGSDSTVSRWENGIARPKIRDVCGLLDLYQVPADDPERARLIHAIRRLWGKA